jgi:hypothetical protein
MSAKPNTWEFARQTDGAYSVFAPRSAGFRRNPPKRWLERDLRVHYGFCGPECEDIVRKLEESGKHRIVL